MDPSEISSKELQDLINAFLPFAPILLTIAIAATVIVFKEAIAAWFRRIFGQVALRNVKPTASQDQAAQFQEVGNAIKNVAAAANSILPHLITQNDELRRANELLATQNYDLKCQKDTLTGELANSNAALSESNKLLAVANTQNAELINKVDNLSSEIHALTERIGELERCVEILSEGKKPEELAEIKARARKRKTATAAA